MQGRKRVVVVGMGSIGRRHARLLNERDDVMVEALDVSHQAVAEVQDEIGELPVHGSLDQMLKTEPDIVLLATPHTCHAGQAIQALEAGAHVFCEKPMSDTVSNAIKMKEAAQVSGRVLNIGFQLHFDPIIRRLQEIISSGTLGSILHAHARVGTYITLLNSISRYQSDQEGALLYDYAHQPDLFHWLLGEVPVGVYACAFEGGDIELSSNPNVVAITCDYASNLISTIHLNYIQMPMRHEYEIVGDKAWVVLNPTSGSLTIGKRSDGNTVVETYKSDRDNIYRDEQQAFFEAVDGKRNPETSAEDGVVSMVICEAAAKSWKTQQRVEIVL